RVDLEAPPRFQAGVWARIAAEESARATVFSRAAEWLAAAFYRPRVAALAVTLGLAVGIGAAFVKAQDSNAALGRQLQARYIETINPLAHGGGQS
ncbi:MAG: hypothetical protein PHQ12_13535, partial [Chthoniobacteraceae bacterium]|nr:hypothetical protein [Chthoniobacteraceae bacterium]